MTFANSFNEQGQLVARVQNISYQSPYGCVKESDEFLQYNAAVDVNSKVDPLGNQDSDDPTQ